jgi:hypothetical protein
VSTVLWESVDEDTDGAWTPASGTYTFKRAGLWSASMLTNWDGTLSTGQRSPAFNIVNATPASPSIGQIFGTFAAAVNDPAGNGRQAFGISFRVRPGDTMQFQVYQNTNQSIWLRPQSWGECHWVCD